jgi:putative ABC transport system permease protein
LWRRDFAANPDIVGKDIRMNGEPYTVVGVLPPGIHDRFNSQLWVPLVIQTDATNQAMRSVSVMARLKDGVSIAQAQSEMSAISQQLQSERPKANPTGVSVQPLHLNFLTDATRRNLWLLLSAVGFLLLIACVNVSNLLLARGTSRQREVALRAALGASRSRLFSQFITESLVLAVLGGTVGVLLAGTIIDLVQAVMPPVGTMLPSEANHQDECASADLHDGDHHVSGSAVRINAGVASNPTRPQRSAQVGRSAPAVVVRDERRDASWSLPNLRWP